MPTKTKKKADPATQTLNVAFVWDMSGSMAAIDDATREGTRGYLMDLQKDEKRLVEENGPGVYTRFSLTAFDTRFEQWIVDEPITDIKVKAIVEEYQPRGGTALYDAIANTISDLAESLRKRKATDEKCLVIVMTDGGENSSQEYGGPDGKKRIFNLIKKYEKKGNWTFVYLGAGTEAYQEARNVGIAPGNVGYYSATVASTSRTSDNMNAVTNTIRSMGATSTDVAFAASGIDPDMRDEDDPDRKTSTPGR